MAKIKIEQIKIDKTIYPRQQQDSRLIKEFADAMRGGAVFPPIILEEKSHRLLDGLHRLKAAESIGCYEIDATLQKIPENICPKLFCLSLSSKHGLRPSGKEKEIAAQEQYLAFPGTPNKKIAEMLGVSEETIAKYLESLIAKHEENVRSVILRLDKLGWTQEEIAAKLQELWPEAKGTSQDSISNLLRENLNSGFLVKIDLRLPAEEIAKRLGLPEILAWAIKLDGKKDMERMEILDINIQPYDVWNFGSCHELFGFEYPGRIPGQILAHVLYFFTNPGDLVLDPMAGSGTTQDACLVMGRKCYAYDIENSGQRPDVILHNLKNGWPDRIKKARFIFWDPPYFQKKDSDYATGSISNLSRIDYLKFFKSSLQEASSVVKKGTKLGLLMSDFDDLTDSTAGIFIWDYADILRNSEWKLKRQIQIPLSTQQVHPDIVLKFRESKRLARLERYLIIAEAQ